MPSILNLLHINTADYIEVRSPTGRPNLRYRHIKANSAEEEVACLLCS